MHKFEVGDQVEVIGSLVAPNMKQGTILRVLPHSGFLERPAEYEVLFGLKTALYYGTQLRAIHTAFDED
jgi:hypothetical protein